MIGKILVNRLLLKIVCLSLLVMPYIVLADNNMIRKKMSKQQVPQSVLKSFNNYCPPDAFGEPTAIDIEYTELEKNGKKIYEIIYTDGEGGIRGTKGLCVVYYPNGKFVFPPPEGTCPISKMF